MRQRNHKCAWCMTVFPRFPAPWGGSVTPLCSAECTRLHAEWVRIRRALNVKHRYRTDEEYRMQVQSRARRWQMRRALRQLSMTQEELA